jgi:hypothetical protein
MRKKKISSMIIVLIFFTTVIPIFSVEANSVSLNNDIKITIGAGMLRGTIAGISFARPIGFGTNIRVKNNGIDSYNGSWELVYSSFSDDFIKNKKGNFVVTPDDPVPYLKSVIIYTTLKDKICRLSMTVKVGDYEISRSGIRIGPLVVLGMYS